MYGDLIGRFLRGDFGSNETVHPQLVALLFAEDRHGAAAGIKEHLNAGETVLLDRYVYSNIAYQCAKLDSEEESEALRKWIIDTEYGEFGIPRPDINLFLDVPIGFVEANLTAQRQGDDRDYLSGGRDIHEADIAFQKRVRSIYLKQASLDEDFLVVDCSDDDGSMLGPDEIFERIRAIVDKRLH